MHLSENRSIIVFHVTLAVVVFLLSVITANGALKLEGAAEPNWLLFILASTEAIAALLFLIPRTTVIGGYLLIVIFVIAFLLHLTIGEYQLPLLIYATGTYFIISHVKAGEPKLNRETK